MLSAFIVSGARAQPLTAEDFRQIGPQGFGDRANSYAWSMAYFHGKLYIGTNHNFLCVARSAAGVAGEGQIPELPVECDLQVSKMDLRGRIYTYDPATGEIELIYISPTVNVTLSDGSKVPVARDAGYRTMVVFPEADGTEALYVGTFATRDIPNARARMLRSGDGKTFTDVSGPVSSGPAYGSFRSFTVYKDRLFVLAIGGATTESALLESANPSSGAFQVVSESGFGDPVNLAGFELAVFKGYLYVGTGTVSEGFQLLKTQANGPPPYVFQKVLVNGAYRGSKNQNVVSLFPYRDYLYVGTGVNFAALNLFGDGAIGPPELLRVRADDSWEIVAGAARDTPEGFKAPISGRGPGLGNALTGYFWRMTEFQGVLYVGTFDLSVVAPYAENLEFDNLGERIDADLPPEFYALLARLDPNEVADVAGAIGAGFDLWASPDGTHFELVSHNGLGDDYSYGVRNFVSLPFGLFVGTANPFYGFRLYLGQEPGTDTDGDSYQDWEDNCPLTWNLSQADRDGDGIGDACDPDTDGDCIPNASDSRPFIAQPDPTDTDADGESDRCENDDDNDGVLDTQDNCPLVANPDQVDTDADGVGDACDSAAVDSTDGQDVTPDNPPDGNTVDQPLPSVPQPCGAGMGAVLLASLLGMVGMRSGHRRFRYGDA